MTLNDIYLISQILAVAALIPSVLYLAMQVRQNTMQGRASARFQWVEASGQFNALIAGNTSTASVFQRGWDDPDALDDAERMQFLVMLGHFMQIYSTMFEQHQDKLLPDTQWHNCRKDMIAVMNSPGGLWVWNTFGKKGLGPDFVNYMEALVTGEETSFDLTKVGKSKGTDTEEAVNSK